MLPAGFELEDDLPYSARDMFGEVGELLPGANFTSGYRTRDYQADMRRRGYNPARNSDHLTGGAFDIGSVPGMSLGQAASHLRERYPDARVLYGDPGHLDHVHVAFPGYESAPPLGGAVSYGVENPVTALPQGFELEGPTEAPQAAPDGNVQLEAVLLGGIVEQANGDRGRLLELAMQRGLPENEARQFVEDELGPDVLTELAQREGEYARATQAGFGPGIDATNRTLNAFNVGLTEGIGAPVDLMSAGLNLIPGINIDNPVGGSRSLQQGANALGLAQETPDMAPRSVLESYIHSIARAGGQTSVPALGIIGQGSRLANRALASLNALRTSTALRTGNSALAPMGATREAGTRLLTEAGRRPGVALATEAGASLGQGVMGETARRYFPDNPLVQTLAETGGAVLGGFAAGVPAYRSPRRRSEAGGEQFSAPRSPSASTDLPPGFELEAGGTLIAPRLDTPTRGTIAAMADETPVPTVSVPATRAMDANIPDPQLSATLPEGFQLEGQMISRPSASEIADMAEGAAPGDFLPRPANRITDLGEWEMANPPLSRPAPIPDEMAELTMEVGRRGPLDLVTWLRTSGGVREEAGELSHAGIGNAPRDLDFARNENFLGRLVNEEGMTIDEAGEAAWEAGFFDERPTPREFLEALVDTYSGTNRLFRPEDYEQVGRFEAARTTRYAMEDAASEGRPIFEEIGQPATMADLDANAAPVTAYEDLAEASGRVGNIDVSRLRTPQEITQAIRQTEQAMGGFDAARRGRISHAETGALADDLGLTVDDLLKRTPGQALNAEQALGARRILAASANDLVNKARAAAGGSEEALTTFRRSLIRHAAIQEQVTGMTAEAGRALQQFRILAEGADARLPRLGPDGSPRRLPGGARAVDPILEGGGGRDRVEATAQYILDLYEERGPAALNRFSRDAVNPSIGDKVWSLWYNAILSGPYTHLRNILGNSVNMLVNFSEHGLATGIGKARNLVTGSTDRISSGELAARLYGAMQGVIDGVGYGARAFRTGEASDYTSKLELNQTTSFRGPASYVLEAPSRALLAEDEWFKSIARLSEIRGQAFRIAANEGLTGEALAERAAALVDNPTTDMLEAAGDYARELTFQESLQGITESIQRARTIRPDDSIGTMAARSGLRFIVPFIRTPVNLLRTAARRTPLGLASSRNIADFRAGGARRDLAIARVTAGTGVTALLFHMAREGLLTGAGPQDWRERADLEATGWQRNSVRVGDTNTTYSGLDPFAITAGSIASIVENQESYSDEQWAEMVPHAILGVAENLTNQTWTSGLSDFIGTLRDPERNMPYWVSRQASSVTVPAIVRQLNSSMVDPVRRETRGDGTILGGRMANTIRSAIPGLSQSLPARHDVLGRELRNEGAFGPDAISPLFQRTARNEAVMSEVRRLGITIGPPKRSVGEWQLSAAEFQEYQRVSGQMILAELQGAMADPVWQTLSDQERRDEIDRFVGHGLLRAGLFDQRFGTPGACFLQPGALLRLRAADRPPEGALRAARQPLRRRLHRLARDEPHRRRGEPGRLPRPRPHAALPPERGDGPLQARHPPRAHRARRARAGNARDGNRHGRVSRRRERGARPPQRRHPDDGEGAGRGDPCRGRTRRHPARPRRGPPVRCGGPARRDPPRRRHRPVGLDSPDRQPRRPETAVRRSQFVEHHHDPDRQP